MSDLDGTTMRRDTAAYHILEGVEGGSNGSQRGVARERVVGQGRRDRRLQLQGQEDETGSTQRMAALWMRRARASSCCLRILRSSAMRLRSWPSSTYGWAQNQRGIVRFVDQHKDANEKAHRKHVRSLVGLAVLAQLVAEPDHSRVSDRRARSKGSRTHCSSWASKVTRTPESTSLKNYTNARRREQNAKQEVQQPMECTFSKSWWSSDIGRRAASTDCSWVVMSRATAADGRATHSERQHFRPARHGGEPTLHELDDAGHGVVALADLSTQVRKDLVDRRRLRPNEPRGEKRMQGTARTHHLLHVGGGQQLLDGEVTEEGGVLEDLHDSRQQRAR